MQIMSIGYACLTTGIAGMRQRTCILKNADPQTLEQLIGYNLDILDRILDYNLENNIKLFRISSDIIPFGSHPINTLKWWDIFSDKLRALGTKAKAGGIRLSMHPGQYTLLNSPSEDVTSRSVEDLRYHCRFLDSLGMGAQHKMVLHIGGIYGDKTAAIKRFIEQYRCLDPNIRRRLIIENDDRQYTASDVLSIGEAEGIPVVFDNLHHQVHPDNSRSETEWIKACSATWSTEDGPQKLHYSQQAEDKKPGSHSATVDAGIFLDFYNRLPKSKPDIMLEVKDKNLSALKCIALTSSPEIAHLEKEWSRYKYLVLEHSPQAYKQIRELLKDKTAYPAVEFYRIIDHAVSSPVSPGHGVNAAQHVWGYVNTFADEKEQSAFEKNIEKLSKGGSSTALKRLLWKLSETQQQEYLLNSLYFLEFHK